MVALYSLYSENYCEYTTGINEFDGKVQAISDKENVNVVIRHGNLIADENYQLRNGRPPAVASIQVYCG